MPTNTELHPQISPAASSSRPSEAPDATNFRRFMRNRHRPLFRLYKDDPTEARIVDGARTSDDVATSSDPIHGELVIGTSQPHRAPLAIHSAVGGDHDGPNPGDYLAAALAGCFDRTMRIVANRLDIGIESLSVAVGAEIDVRGTLCIDTSVPVGFQRLTVKADVRLQEGASPHALDILRTATEHSCVVLQTLRGGVDVEVCVNESK